MMAKPSDGIFDECPAKEMPGIMEEFMQTSTRPSVRDRELEEEQMNKYEIAWAKMDKGHTEAIFSCLVKPKESVEKQEHALSSIFQVIDLKTQSS